MGLPLDNNGDSLKSEPTNADIMGAIAAMRGDLFPRVERMERALGIDASDPERVLVFRVHTLEKEQSEQREREKTRAGWVTTAVFGAIGAVGLSVWDWIKSGGLKN